MKRNIGIALGLVALGIIIMFVTHSELFFSDRGWSDPIVYVCNSDRTITATYWKGKNLPPEAPNMPPRPQGKVSLVLSDGRTMLLDQTISADGVRYTNADESFIFWSKGNGALILEHYVEKSYIGCIATVSLSGNEDLPRAYANNEFGFSLRLPEGYRADDRYAYVVNPEKKIWGSKFTIPQDFREGTNLSSDTYIGVEFIPNTEHCLAGLFLDGEHEVREINDAHLTYSVADLSNAGAGNRYEETIYAISGTNPCVGVRYFIHYTALENYDPGSKRAFDREELLRQFDAIRRTIVLR